MGRLRGFILAGDGDDGIPAKWNSETEAVSALDGHPMSKAGLVDFLEL